MEVRITPGRCEKADSDPVAQGKARNPYTLQLIAMPGGHEPGLEQQDPNLLPVRKALSSVTPHTLRQRAVLPY